MNKILIPVDFSDNSLRAMEYGLKLAEEFSSSVTLLYSYEGYQPGNVMMSMRKLLEEEAQIEMKNVLSHAKEIAPTMKLHPLVVRGQAAHEIVQTAKDNDYDLIVMGTNGASGLTEIFIGSVANEVIKQTKLPVIVVPVGYTYSSLKTIVLSLSDDLIKDPVVVAPLTNLITQTGANLEVYHFGRKEEKTEDLAENLDILDKMTDSSVTYAYDTDKKGINTRIRDFAEEKQADLICLLRQKHNFWANLFGKSVTSRQTFHSSIPLLILQNKE